MHHGGWDSTRARRRLVVCGYLPVAKSGSVKRTTAARRRSPIDRTQWLSWPTVLQRVRAGIPLSVLQCALRRPQPSTPSIARDRLFRQLSRIISASTHRAIAFQSSPRLHAASTPRHTCLITCSIARSTVTAVRGASIDLVELDFLRPQVLLVAADDTGAQASARDQARA